MTRPRSSTIPAAPLVRPPGRLIAALALGAVLAVGACTQSGGGASGGASGAAGGGDYPSRSINFVVPFAAGGPTDTVTRLVAEPMGKGLGQQIVVQNVA